MKNKVLFLILLALISCNTNHKALDNYFNQSSIKLKSKTIKIKNSFYGDAFSIEIYDSLLFLLDSYNNNEFSLIDIKNKQFIKRFGKKGNGPNEIIGVGDIKLDVQNKKWIFLTNNHKLCEYNISDIVNDSIPVFNEVTMFDNEKGVPFTAVTLNNNSGFITTGLFHYGKYGIYNYNGKLIKEIGEIKKGPDQEKIDNFLLGMGYQGRLLAHPYENKIVHLSINCDLIEILNYNNKNNFLIKSFQTYFPIFSDLINTDSKAIATSKDNKLGYTNFAVTSKYIYAPYSGRTFDKHSGKSFKTNKIYVFDWELNPVKIFELDYDIWTIAVSEDDKKAYSIVLTDNLKMELVFWDLK